jgi:hypothetical protein
VSFPFDGAPASEEAKSVTLGNCPLFLLVAPDSTECGGPSLYRAGAPCNLITLDISALYSASS